MEDLSHSFPRITAHTRIYGVIGYPVRHSLSPILHNRAFSEFQIPAVYLAFEVHPQELENAFLGIRALQISGVNVTIPFKEMAVEFVDSMDPWSQKVRAINTVVFHDGKLYGYNTDGPGFYLALSEVMGGEYLPEKVLLVGCGGAGRSVVFYLAEKGVREFYLMNRTHSKAEELWRDLVRYYPHLKGGILPFVEPIPSNYLEGISLLVQATSVGLKGKEEILLHWERISPSTVVADLVYNWEETPFLKKARERGCRVVDGKAILVGQALLAFEHFTTIRWEFSRAMEWLLSGKPLLRG